MSFLDLVEFFFFLKSCQACLLFLHQLGEVGPRGGRDCVRQHPEDHRGIQHPELAVISFTLWLVYVLLLTLIFVVLEGPFGFDGIFEKGVSAIHIANTC